MRKTSLFRSVFKLRPPRRGFLLFTWLMILAPLSRGQESDPDLSYLNFTNWNAVAYSHEVGGTLCWLEGPDGSLRLEVRRGPADFPMSDLQPAGPWPAELDPLLNRVGEGWTVVLGPDDEGTMNAWGREWRAPPVGLVQMIRLLTLSLDSRPGPPAALPFASFLGSPRNGGGIPSPVRAGLGEGGAGPQEKLRYELAPLDLEESADNPKEGFRAGMAARGRGNGGLGEIVTLSWQPISGRPGSRVKIMSSRRPGTLVLDAPDRRPVETPPPELFLPLWPLSEFF